jgi:NAD(P)-dependent dehydrogenase (short-subunit alcohol dehydrogenase family)
MREARSAFGSLDMVVNCAGLGAITPVMELTGDEWQAVAGRDSRGSLLRREARSAVGKLIAARWLVGQFQAHRL